MAVMRCITGLLVLLAVLAWTEAVAMRRVNGDSDDDDEGHLLATEQLEKANSNPDYNRGAIEISRGKDVPPFLSLRKALSRLRGSLWLKSTDGNVYVPYVIAEHFLSQELDIIRRGLDSFSNSTCIRFVPHIEQRDYLYIQALDGCYSYVGRQGDSQIVSLSREGCIHHGKVQHELLHALGFSHEHCRSDRDQHISVLLQNVITGQEHNFNKTNTLNERTPYDYSSVMHYSRLAFSKDNNKPTMVAVPDHNIMFGIGRQMSQNDINRVNLLYCTN